MYINRWTQLISTLDAVRADETNKILAQSAAIFELLEENKSTIQHLLSTMNAAPRSETILTPTIPVLHSRYTPPVKEFSGDLIK
ncbi:unnamed protein product [Gongylonema pulchrum]|uniref:CaMBD domain-containing protein n=1 Tax=Gongylonema pulchrum TaxID=637853 RepID=A0A183EFH4_9BILA|nr:unnamed protein product [Gongylonema pulchrum]